MAWTSPHTYTDGEIVTHDLLNTDLRDNLNFIGTVHNHSSAGATAGNPALGSLNAITWADQSGAPGATGTMQRNGNNLEYHAGDVGVVVMGGVATATTASLRALGNANGTQAANGTHVHTLVDADGTAAISTGAVSANYVQWVGGVSNAALGTQSPTGTSLIMVNVVLIKRGGNDGTYRFVFDGTVWATGSLGGGTPTSLTTGTVFPRGAGDYTGSHTISGTAVAFYIGTVVGIGTPA